ncbi:MAG: hypothetical protein QGG25_18510, partial [Phycisphaerae bacterium]|nr:hypothetical protein [Phycisphaerae bacterium]
MPINQIKGISAGAVLLATISFIGAVDAQAGSTIKLTNVTAETGISFRHTDGGSGKRYLLETVCAGMAMLDYDGDG